MRDMRRMRIMEKYKLTKTIPEQRIYEVYIDADSNDADYISTTTVYTQDEFDKIVDGLIDLNNNYMDYHELEEYENEYDLDIPCNSWGEYCHTLEEVKITMYDTDGYVYEVELNQ
jgi:hypothetical protein